ncbi:MAG: GntR family transcriptional regulator [Oscillospiraceae bacterium]|nr:GntR family transcriptional regulator [Oscillospiraceae bacterium]
MPDTLRISLVRDGGTPFSEQIYNSILRQILHGELSVGQQLPAERDLAVSLDVARGTVKRAYSRLRDVEAIEIRKGSGSYVLKNDSVLEAIKNKESLDTIAHAFQKLENMGVTRSEILRLVNTYCENPAN